MNIVIVGMGNTGKEIVKQFSNHNIFPVKKLSDFKKIKDKIDYVIISFSAISNKERKRLTKKVSTTYELRQAELKKNINELRKMLPYLKQFNCKILVLTNPIDEITNYLRIKLRNKQIFGFGMQLDQRRFSEVYGKNIDCIGLHGKAIPIINGKTLGEYKLLYNKVDKKLFEFVSKKGIPAKLAAREFMKWFDILIGKKEKTIYACYYFGGISISRPFIVKNGKVVGVKKLKLNRIEKKLLKDSIRELKFKLKKIK